MKKGLLVMLSIMLLLSVVLAGCGGSTSTSTDEKPKTIKVANYFADDHPQNIALLEKFKPMVEEKSGGKLKVEIYSNSKLGAEQEFTDGVRNGTIEMGIPGMILQSSMATLGVPEWPFLFESYTHANKVLNGPIGDELTEGMVEQFGVRPLAWSANGFRVVSSNRPIKSMEDFKGFRLRMPNIPNYIEMGQLWGANVTPMAISEVFTGLEQKVIDGQDNPYATLVASGWHEVQSNVLQSYHMFSPNLYIINEKFWQSLTPEQQEIVAQASKEAADYEWQLLESKEEELKKFLEEKGLEITIPSDELKQQLKDSVKPMYDRFYKDYDWAKDLVERIAAEAK